MNSYQITTVTVVIVLTLWRTFDAREQGIKAISIRFTVSSVIAIIAYSISQVLVNFILAQQGGV